MKDLPLNALRAFVAVYSHRGVRAAALELGIVHSSVSRHLSELERWLGAPLIEGSRGRAGISLTPRGEALGRAVLAAFGDIERVATSLRESRANRSATITTAPSFAARWLLPRLAAFDAVRPRIEVSVLVDQRIEDPRAKGADFAIRMGAGPWPEVRCEPLMDEVLYPVMSPSLWRKTGRPRTSAQLRGLPLLHDRDPHASWETWRHQHGPKSLDVTRGPRFASSDLVLRAAAQGQGVALARHRLAVDDIASGALMRPIDELRIELGVAYWLVLPLRTNLSATAGAVAEWLTRQTDQGAYKP
jgi:LysR family transcriptional regulator, glycine cleavage system transcriptional activator